MPIKFDNTIKASDVLTSLTIILSVIALITTWNKDRDTTIREQANQVRAAAANTLVKLERWQVFQRSLYAELQPAYVETSEMLAVHYDVIKTRDHLWKKINSERAQIAGRVLDEAIETAYVDLFAYHPSIRTVFLDVIAKLHESENDATSKLLLDTQAAIMSFEGKKTGYSSALLGNALRNAANPIEDAFVQETTRILEPIRDDLYKLISSDDETILKRAKGGFNDFYRHG